MAQHRVYGSPPLIEALCDIRFEPKQEWDWTIPGLLYAQIQDEYPTTEQTEQFELKLQDSQAPQHQVTRRMRYFRDDKSALVQVGENSLVFNCLRPYPGWGGFRSSLVSLVEKYARIATLSGVAECALRYINRVEFAEDRAILEEYLQTVPTIPKNLPDQLVGWSLALDIPDNKRAGIMRLKAGSVPPEKEGGVAFILDLRFQTAGAAGLRLDNSLFEWIDNAHEVIEETFEASITEQARVLFREEPVHEQLPAR